MSQELRQLGNDLEQEKESFSKRKKEIEDKLREYARKRLIEEKRVLLSAIFNGEENTSDVLLTTYKFVLGNDEIIEDLEKVELSGLNQNDDVFESINSITTSNIKRQKHPQIPLESLSVLERTHIKKKIDKEIDAMVIGFINGDISYQDDAFINLIRTYKAIEQELERLNGRIGLLNNKGESK